MLKNWQLRLSIYRSSGVCADTPQYGILIDNLGEEYYASRDRQLVGQRHCCKGKHQGHLVTRGHTNKPSLPSRPMHSTPPPRDKPKDIHKHDTELIALAQFGGMSSSGCVCVQKKSLVEKNRSSMMGKKNCGPLYKHACFKHTPRCPQATSRKNEHMRRGPCLRCFFGARACVSPRCLSVETVSGVLWEVIQKCVSGVSRRNDTPFGV